MKLVTHKCSHWRKTGEEEISDIKKKQSNKIKSSALKGKSTKYISPEFLFNGIGIKDIRQNDIWKVGLWVLEGLLGDNLDK